jgi:hypothetical protein
MFIFGVKIIITYKNYTSSSNFIFSSLLQEFILLVILTIIQTQHATTKITAMAKINKTNNTKLQCTKP